MVELHETRFKVLCNKIHMRCTYTATTNDALSDYTAPKSRTKRNNELLGGNNSISRQTVLGASPTSTLGLYKRCAKRPICQTSTDEDLFHYIAGVMLRRRATLSNMAITSFPRIIVYPSLTVSLSGRLLRQVESLV